MTDEEKLKAVQDFIYSDDVQNDLEAINNLLLPINVLEITGMGSQEIKHSNVLAWMFGDNQHQLGYEILAKFLGKVAAKEGDNESKSDDILVPLRHYAYFPKHERDIVIKREWNNIDLLIEDKANHVVIVIENKVWAGESDTQIAAYEATAGKVYPRKGTGASGNSKSQEDEWDVFYIFLTPDSVEVKNEKAQKNWLIAQYQTIHDIIKAILANETRDIPDQARMMLESYNDLLIKEGIVSNDKVKELCEKIWKHNKDALDVLIINRPDNNEEIYKVIENHLEKIFPDICFLTNPNSNNRFNFKTQALKAFFKDESKTDDKFFPAYYALRFSKDEGLYLDFNISSNLNEETKTILWHNESCRLKQKNHSVKLSKNNSNGWVELVENVDKRSSFPNEITNRGEFKQIVEAIRSMDDFFSSCINKI